MSRHQIRLLITKSFEGTRYNHGWSYWYNTISTAASLGPPPRSSSFPRIADDKFPINIRPVHLEYSRKTLNEIVIPYLRTAIQSESDFKITDTIAVAGRLTNARSARTRIPSAQAATYSTYFYRLNGVATVRQYRIVSSRARPETNDHGNADAAIVIPVCHSRGRSWLTGRYSESAKLLSPADVSTRRD